MNFLLKWSGFRGQVFWGLGVFHLWRNSSDSSLGPPPPDALGKLPDKTLDPDPDVTFGGQRGISGPISADPISSTSAVPEGGWWFRFVLTKWRPNCVLLVFFWRAIF